MIRFNVVVKYVTEQFPNCFMSRNTLNKSLFCENLLWYFQKVASIMTTDIMSIHVNMGKIFQQAATIVSVAECFESKK